MSTASAPHLRRTLGPVTLTLFGLSYMAIGTVFTTYGIVNQITEGHLVASYVVALVVMLFTASSYAAMVRRYPVAGSAYTYSQQSFGGAAGFLTGWVLLLDYLFIPMINFLILGLYVGTQFPSVPSWVFTLAALVGVFIFNVLGISLVGKINTAIVVVSLAAVLVFAILAIKTAINDPNAPSLIEPFIPGSAGYSPIFTGAAVLALSFLGFDAVSTLSEEAKRPRTDIPRAIMLTTIIGGLLFIFVSWVGARAYFLDDWSQASQQLLDAAGVVLFSHVGGEVLTVIFIIITVAGCFGSGLAGQVAVSRILYSMGRDGILPRPLGILSKRFGTPVVAATVVSVFALSGLFLSLDQAAFMISFGALAAFAMVNLAVIRSYLFPKGGRQDPLTTWQVIRYGAIPLIGFGLTIWLWTSLEALTWLVGGIWMLIGVIILALKTGFFRRPVPKLDFSEDAPSTEAIDALAEEYPLHTGRD
ncbi:APC family permease [Leucobacter massiliensis]|uniref:Putrescine importer PuuP n=1 Tax=Leucobacter massiliensis TaxID=1686285 RepID=A0A2S9QNW7_9MICO|nr:APC family permease [Leucobacter massiliensis]PRI11275.1 Putrescine importer PuuP [Leucobacter massiliensis]